MSPKSTTQERTDRRSSRQATTSDSPGLSYDHRLIDGALAARFTARVSHLLGDVRRLVL